MLSVSPQSSRFLAAHHLCCARNRIAILKASGSRVREYMQGQITQDIKGLSASSAIYTALLTPQGKAVSELYIMQCAADELLLFTPADYAEKVVARLRNFSVGFALRIGVFSPLSLISVQGVAAADALQKLGLPATDNQRLHTLSDSSRNIFAMAVPEAAEEGFWLAVPTDQVDIMLDILGNRVEEDEMEAARIIRGTPRFGCEWDESVYPLNANLIEQDGVSFEKGCYVGQEVVSRMQWRGGIKKRLYRVALESLPAALPAPVATTVEIGAIASAAMDGDDNIFGIAHLPIKVVEAGTPLIDPEGDSVQIIEPCHG